MVSERSQSYLVTKVNEQVIHYLNLKFCNDALSEIMRCQVGNIDFSKLKKITLKKKAGPYLCFQPIFKAVALNQTTDQRSRASMRTSSASIGKEVRFAADIETGLK